MRFGLSAGQDCKLSAISRALDEPISLKKIMGRLSHFLCHTAIGQTLQARIVADAAGRVHAETLIVVNPTDMRQLHPEKMTHFGREATII